MKNSKSNSIERKFINSIDIDDYEVETDDGFVDIVAIHETIPYLKYIIKTKNGHELECADDHILFDENMNEKFAKEFNNGDLIMTKSGIDEVIQVLNTGIEENMFDLELCENSNHRYYTNNILSHNTLLAKKLAEELFGSEDAIIRIDMSEYSEKSSVAKLTGSAPGYIGYEDGGVLTSAIKNKPYSVILLDEIEKADESIFNLFLQIFDEGRLSESNGNVINCKNCLFIMTSNIGAKQAADLGAGIGFSTNEEDNKKSIIEKEIKRKFTPEFLNRIDKIVYFNPLTDDNLRDIVKLEINKFGKRLKMIKHDIKYDDSVVSYIHQQALKQKEYGARPIIRLIQNSLEDKITDMILEHDYEPEYAFTATCNNNNIEIR